MALLQGYADTSFAGDQTDQNYTTGVVITYKNAPIYWARKKKSLMSMSTAEWEYIAVIAGEKKRQAIKIMCIATNIMDQEPCLLRTYNQATFLMIEKAYGTKHRKFIDLRHHSLALIKHNHLKTIHIPESTNRRTCSPNTCSG